MSNPFLQLLLTPLSWLYGLVTGLRNFLYDKSIIKSYHPDIPVILVGNLIAGGTGKTPVVVWITWKLSEKYRVAILSRGYGRRTRGFQLLDVHSTPETAGDEPMELRLLLPGIPIAIDRNRKHGIQVLSSGKYGKIDLIVMDDGFQHRRVTPGFSIILDDFNRPLRHQKLLPAGLRRESLSALKRADLVVVTKKHIRYAGRRDSSRILLVTGIANPQPLADEISKIAVSFHHLKFPDHHRYTHAEACSIKDLYFSLLQEAKDSADPTEPLILTTGKDYVKLKLMPELSGVPLTRIPMGPPVEPDQEAEILKKIYQYVEEALGNSRLPAE